MSDYYNGINKEEDEQVKLKDKVYYWWKSLSEQEQWDIIEDYMPENINEETNPDEEYGNMEWDEQFGIYKDNNPREFLTKEEEDEIIGDKEADEKMENERWNEI